MNFLVSTQITIKTIVIALLMLATCPVLSQESGGESAEAQANSTSSAESSNNKPVDSQKNAESKPKPEERVFRPSEEISEDSPVPFPVDI